MGYRKKQRKSDRSGKRKTPKSAHLLRAAESRFKKDLEVRGEAQELDRTGKLPLQATHVILKKKDNKSVSIKRARFKFA